MRLSSKSTQQAFARSPWLKLGSLAGVCILLIVSLFGVWKAFSLPAKTEQPIAVANYEHRGGFDYLVYLKPNSLYGPMLPKEDKQTEQETTPVFFRNIIDKAQLAFSYNFSCSQSLSNVTNKVVVTAIAESPGMWQKEIPVLNGTRKGPELRVDFPLLPLLDSLEKVADDIENEIGITGYQRQFIIKAAVHTRAETALGKIIEDDFSHEITAIIDTTTLKLQGSLEGSDTGSEQGVSYTEDGWFDYEVYLKPNKLYGAVVLRSEGSAVAQPSSSPSPTQPVGPGLVYFRSIIDHITASFSYQFDCDVPVGNLVEEMEVLAILEDTTKTWSKTLTLVPKTTESGSFVIDFPLDLSQFTEVASALGTELNVNTLPCDLTIEAVVHTTGDTDSAHHIDEVFSQSLATKLGGPTLSFTGDLSRTQPGTTVENRMTPVANAWVFRVLSLVGVAFVVLAFLFVLRNSRQAKALTISRVEEEALQAKRKYKGVIVDVAELPTTGAKEVVITVGSVDEVVRTADALLKPVLHQAEADKHTYCVIDGAIRYQHVSQPEDSTDPGTAS
jgi:threonine/homoserine/homoserine lactone efflux protein